MRSRKGKWQPFDALSGYREKLDEVNYEKEKKQRPVLSAEYFEELNLKLQQAILDQTEVCIKYYQDGYIYSIYGIISKVDPVYKTLTVNNQKISLLMITEINI